MSFGTWAGYPAIFVMGMALGLTGGGGSILTVPILVYLFSIPALTATSYSLLIVGLVAAWGAWNARNSKELHFKTGLLFGIPGIAGVLLSKKIIVPQLPEYFTLSFFEVSKNQIILISFSIIMLLAAYSMIRSSPQNQLQKKSTSSSSPGLLIPSGLGVGLVAGFVGAGGGFLIVPALTQVAQLPMKEAVGSSLLIIALQSLLGVLGDFSTLLKFDFLFTGVILMLALVGMTLGGKLRSKIPNHKLKVAFGYFVLIVGLIIFLQEISKGAKL